MCMCIYTYIYIYTLYVLRVEILFQKKHNGMIFILFGTVRMFKSGRTVPKPFKTNRKAFEKHSKAFKNVLEWEKGSGVQITVWELLSSGKIEKWNDFSFRVSP